MNNSASPCRFLMKIGIVLLVVIVLVGLGALVWWQFTKPAPSSSVPVRIGWQVSWATQGQIAQVLKHTNILELNGLKGELKGFSYGGPLNEAALAGEVDVILTADQPAVSLLAARGRWHIVGRLINFRAAIILPVNSSITDVIDLKGKSIAIPFGSSTHRIVLGMIEQAGLKPGVDVTVRNMDILEQASVVQSGNDKQWGELDALASWDPYIAIFEQAGRARVLKQALGLSVVMISDDFTKQHPDVAEIFLKAYIETIFYYALHQDLANRWFAQDSRVQSDLKVLDKAGSFEENLRAKTIGEVRVLLTDSEITQIENGATFARELGLIKQVPDIRKSINLDYATAAAASLAEHPLNLSEVTQKQ